MNGKEIYNLLVTCRAGLTMSELVRLNSEIAVQIAVKQAEIAYKDKK